MNKRVWVVVLIFLTIFITSGQTVKNKPKFQQWEYKFDTSASEKKANELGSEGWELVAIEAHTSHEQPFLATYVF